jgi:chemotaxis-related protein WspB
MLFLLFQLGAERYALDARHVIEVLPLVGIKQIPLAPPGVAGLFDCRGIPVPVLDLSQLTLGRPARQRMSTRIVIVRYLDAAGGEHMLGLIAEKATETFRREPSDFVDSGITNQLAPYLGPVTRDTRGIVQRIDVPSLLPASVRDMLFRPMVTA